MLIDPSKILEKAPLAIVICDKSMRIVWCNPLFLKQFDLVDDQVINHLYSSLPIEMIDDKGELIQFFSTHLKQPVKFQYWSDNDDVAAGFTYHYFLRESQANQKSQLASTKLNQLHLPKRVSWIDFLDYEVSRSRRYDNPLAILKLHCLFVEISENNTEATLQSIIKNTLMEELRWADMVGQTQHDSYIMVLPETPSDMIDNLKNKLVAAISRNLKGLDQNLKYELIFAEACWRKHDDTPKLLSRARHQLVEQLEVLLKNNS